MEQKISNPIPMRMAAASPPLPQHKVDVSPPQKVVKRKGSVADMLARLTASTASSRGKMQESRSVSSPQHRLKTSQSMHTMKIGPSSPTRSTRSHSRTHSNPGTMPVISRPIAIPVSQPRRNHSAMERGSQRHAGQQSPALSSRESSSPSLMSDSSSGSMSSRYSPANSSNVSLGTPRRPAPLPPSQAMSSQPRQKRGPGAVISPSRNPTDPEGALSAGAAARTPTKSGANSPIISDEPLVVGKTRKTPKRPQQPSGKVSPEYVKRSPRLIQSGKEGAVGLGLDLEAKSVHKRVASAPAPPSGSTATKPRSMSNIMQLQQQHLEHQQNQEEAKDRRPSRPEERSNTQQEAKYRDQTRQQHNYHPHPHQPQDPSVSSRTQQMRDRLVELQSITKRNPARTKQAEVHTPVMKQTGFTDLPSPGISPLNTPHSGRGNSPSRSTSQEQNNDVTSLRQKLARLEIRYSSLKEQREQDIVNLQNVNSDLCVAQASRDSLQQQVNAYEKAQQDMKRRLDSLQRSLTRSQRLVRVLGANLEESKVALEEKHMENYALRNHIARLTRKAPNDNKSHRNEGGMLSPPNSISDVGADTDHDSDTPTIKG